MLFSIKFWIFFTLFIFTAMKLKVILVWNVQAVAAGAVTILIWLTVVFTHLRKVIVWGNPIPKSYIQVQIWISKNDHSLLYSMQKIWSFSSNDHFQIRIGKKLIIFSLEHTKNYYISPWNIRLSFNMPKIFQFSAWKIQKNAYFSLICRWWICKMIIFRCVYAKTWIVFRIWIGEKIIIFQN